MIREKLEDNLELLNALLDFVYFFRITGGVTSMTK